MKKNNTNYNSNNKSSFNRLKKVFHEIKKYIKMSKWDGRLKLTKGYFVNREMEKVKNIQGSITYRVSEMSRHRVRGYKKYEDWLKKVNREYKRDKKQQRKSILESIKNLF